MDDCLNLESDPSLVAAARAFVQSRLEAWEASDKEGEALLVVSELVTNAVLHARTVIQLRLSTDGSKLRIEVYDENTRMPIPAICGSDATSGRGLALVAALSTAWGMEQQDDGKVVWAEIGAPGSEPPGDCLDLTDVTNVEHALRLVDGSERQRGLIDAP